MYRAVLVALTLLLSTASSKRCTTDIGSVAFSAAMTQWVSVQPNQNLVYNSVFTNRGNGYNSLTGVFTAPKGGLYVFHLHLMSHHSKEVYVRLFKNDEGIISVFEYQNDSYDNGGNSVILEVNQGDRLYVKANRISKAFGGADSYNTFSGYLIGA